MLFVVLVAGALVVSGCKHDPGSYNKNVPPTVRLSNAPPNLPPTVSLTAPAAGAVFTAPATITLRATATDSDGTVAKVEFLNGATKLGAGTLYGLLDRMGEAGLVEASGEEVVDGRLRRYYRLTGVGEEVVKEEARRYADIVALARGKKLIGKAALVWNGLAASAIF